MVVVKDLKSKVCLVGDGGVGKTSLIRKFVFNQFDDKYHATFGTKISKKRLKYKKQNGDVIDLQLLIWDIMGQRDFKKVQLRAYDNTNGVFIVCDVTRKETLKSLATWLSDLVEVAGNVPIIILANKSDLRDQKKFSMNELAETANELKATFFFTSAKTGANVENAFKKMGTKLINTL